MAVMRGSMKAEMTTGSIVVRVTGAGVTGDGGADVADEPAHAAAATTTPTVTSEAPRARPGLSGRTVPAASPVRRTCPLVAPRRPRCPRRRSVYPWAHRRPVRARPPGPTDPDPRDLRGGLGVA